MSKKRETTFSGVLTNFLEARKQHHKVRGFRLAKMMQVFIEIDGTIYETETIDISAKVIRLQNKFPLKSRGPCVITFRGHAGFQMIATPIVDEQELTTHSWDRLALRNEIDLSILDKSI